MGVISPEFPLFCPEAYVIQGGQAMKKRKR
jgi:hypothetical protein